MRRPSRRAGFSLTELLIAASLIGLVLAVPAILLDASNRAYSTSSNAGAVDLDTRRALDEIARLLRNTGLGHLEAPAGMAGISYATVGFEPCIGALPGDADWGDLQRILLRPEAGEPLDGLDNDGDGLVDEHEVVWVEDVGLPSERTHVLARRVAPSLAGETPGNGLDDNGNGLIDEAGLSIRFDGERVTVALTVMRQDGYGVRLDRTVERTVALRN